MALKEIYFMCSFIREQMLCAIKYSALPLCSGLIELFSLIKEPR